MKRIKKSKLGWNNDFEAQQLWVRIEHWDYKVFVDSFTRPTTTFQFRGVTGDMGETGLADLEVDGDIKIPYQTQYEIEDDPPPDNHGTLELVDRDIPYIDVTLLVASEAYAELFRALSGAFANYGSASLRLNLAHSKGAEQNFWRTEWQKEKLQISHFGLFSGGRSKFAKGAA